MGISGMRPQHLRLMARSRAEEKRKDSRKMSELIFRLTLRFSLCALRTGGQLRWPPGNRVLIFKQQREFVFSPRRASSAGEGSREVTSLVGFGAKPQYIPFTSLQTPGRHKAAHDRAARQHFHIGPDFAVFLRIAQEQHVGAR